MNRLHKYTLRYYTLVEIMVAVAILVIMMGFLFQFVIGAQRIWSASTRTGSLFEKAQIVFEVMETDLKNAVISAEPGREIPFYRNFHNTDAHGSDLYFGIMSNYSSSVTPTEVSPYENRVVVDMYPVLYLFDHTRHIFYRCAVDSCYFDSSPPPSPCTPNISQWFTFGIIDATSGDYYANLINNSSSPFYIYPHLLDVMADGVETVEIQTLPTTVTGYTTQKPRVVRIVLTLYDPEADRLTGQPATTRRDEPRRVFSKIIFMP